MFINSINDYLDWRKAVAVTQVKGKRKILVDVPCVHTLLVKYELIQANNYNPNNVSPDKMELLRESVLDNGFCFPIVTIYDHDLCKFVIIDGFHRWDIAGQRWLGLSHVPVVVLPHDLSKRLTATWQFNKARGVHQVDLDAELIRMLIHQGLEEDEIAKKLGIDLDSVHRYKQLTGIADLFKNSPYSMSWATMEVNDSD